MIYLSGTGFELGSLMDSATQVLQWFITSLGSILTFFTSNTALLVWFLVSLVGAGFVFFRKLF